MRAFYGTWVHRYFERRRAIKKFKKQRWEAVERERGFNWAFEEYFTSRLSLLHIEGYVESSKCFGPYDSFDMGVEDALRQLRAMGMKQSFNPKDITVKF